MAEPDPAAALAFLRWWFAYTEDNPIEIRALPQVHGEGPVRPLFTRSPKHIRAHVLKWDQPGRAVYFGTCTRRKGAHTGSRENVVEVPGLWIDLDQCDKPATLERLRALESPPHKIIDSGGGLHAYWRFDEPEEPHDSIIDELRLLADRLGGDPTCCDLARVMRLPGTRNFKPGVDGALCSVIWERE